MVIYIVFINIINLINIIFLYLKTYYVKMVVYVC